MNKYALFDEKEQKYLYTLNPLNYTNDYNIALLVTEEEIKNIKYKNYKKVKYIY